MVKINRLEIENVKRVQAVQIEPSASGLTVIGGRNKQGKTSVLDAILWALGGGKHKPSSAQRDGSAAELSIKIELDNGIVVKRDGKNSSLKVIDSNGNKAGQALLDELIGQLALDLPKFLESSSREKAETLLQIIGVGDQLHLLDRQAETLYNERHAIGLVATRKKKHAEDLPFEKDAPAEVVSASELIQQQQAILARNGEKKRLVETRNQLERECKAAVDAEYHASERFKEATEHREFILGRLTEASKPTEQLVLESTEELERSLQGIDAINRKVRTNETKLAAETEAGDLQEQADQKTAELEIVRTERLALLDGADLPLPGLSIDAAELTYEGKVWDSMSSADQLQVAVAIVRRLKPECQFVLLDKLEQMDLETLTEFGLWLETEGLQVIATRVSTGDECSVIIEDGLVQSTKPQTVKPATVAASEGGF